jgi:hypothetical protein
MSQKELGADAQKMTLHFVANVEFRGSSVRNAAVLQNIARNCGTRFESTDEVLTTETRWPSANKSWLKGASGLRKAEFEQFCKLSGRHRPA